MAVDITRSGGTPEALAGLRDLPSAVTLESKHFSILSAALGRLPNVVRVMADNRRYGN